MNQIGKGLRPTGRLTVAVFMFFSNYIFLYPDYNAFSPVHISVDCVRNKVSQKTKTI